MARSPKNNKKAVFLERLSDVKDYCFRRSKKRAQNLSSLLWRDVEALKDLSDCHTTKMDSLEAGAALTTITLVSKLS